ncbi:unnamed protein product [Moneuplotes crassus]|uniref:Uncharacterized protein n=1 Tax=Euplotes crassus TaxID=5936 RepID=A0AAD1XQ23_EUPCR|nr:unnamed protein product [Moneuplotes crassus]
MASSALTHVLKHSVCKFHIEYNFFWIRLFKLFPFPFDSPLFIHSFKVLTKFHILTRCYVAFIILRYHIFHNICKCILNNLNPVAVPLSNITCCHCKLAQSYIIRILTQHFWNLIIRKILMNLHLLFKPSLTTPPSFIILHKSLQIRNFSPKAFILFNKLFIPLLQPPNILLLPPPIIPCPNPPRLHIPKIPLFPLHFLTLLHL